MSQARPNNLLDILQLIGNGKKAIDVDCSIGKLGERLRTIKVAL